MVGPNHLIINHHLLKKLLRRSDRPSIEVDRLMDPADSQDVPRAISFIEAIEEVAALPTDPSCNPGELEEIRIVALLSDVLTAFMDPFISPSWSLTEQVVSLSKYAHLSCALFRDHGQNFMPNQLYSDTQCTVKNALFCIAKQQKLDASRPYHLFKEGDDSLEELFGRVRMQGGHSPNFTYKQFTDRLAAAMDLSAIFRRNPDLDEGFRRMKVSRLEDLDHLNSTLWRGCVIASSVDLEAAWMLGRQQAVSSLQIAGIDVNFGNIFLEDRATDILKPRGGNKYPGVAEDSGIDRSLEPEEIDG